MNKQEKKKLIKILCNKIRSEAVSKVTAMPDNWDGVEVREFLAEKFSAERCPMDNGRKREFNNSVLIHNL